MGSTCITLSQPQRASEGDRETWHQVVKETSQIKRQPYVQLKRGRGFTLLVLQRLSLRKPSLSHPPSGTPPSPSALAALRRPASTVLFKPGAKVSSWQPMSAAWRGFNPLYVYLLYIYNHLKENPVSTLYVNAHACACGAVPTALPGGDVFIVPGWDKL